MSQRWLRPCAGANRKKKSGRAPLVAKLVWGNGRAMVLGAAGLLPRTAWPRGLPTTCTRRIYN